MQGIMILRRQTIGAKVYCQKGNSPDLIIRIFLINLVIRLCRNRDISQVSLEAASCSKKRYSFLAESLQFKDV